jgi:hypothetical protein
MSRVLQAEWFHCLLNPSQDYSVCTSSIVVVGAWENLQPEDNMMVSRTAIPEGVRGWRLTAERPFNPRNFM